MCWSLRTRSSLERRYRRIAEALTRAENHHYESSAHDALVLKRFLFEACNAFVALFYVAFVEMDIFATRAILISLCVRAVHQWWGA